MKTKTVFENERSQFGTEAKRMKTVPSGGVCSTGHCMSADFNCDGDAGTDLDIEAFFAALAGHCPDGC